jgi:hypothetical protein
MSRPSSPRPDAPLRRLGSVVAAAVLGLVLVLVVAGLAAGSGGSDGEVTVPQVGVPTQWFDLVIGLIGVFTMVVWGLLIAGLVSEPGDGRRQRAVRSIPGMLLIGALMWFVLTVWTPADQEVVIEPPPPTPTTTTLPADDAPPVGDTTGSPLLPWLGAVVVLAAAAALVAWSLRRGTDELDVDQAESDRRQRRDLLIGLLDDALADLRAHPDPRAAVIAAWARLEDAFASVDVARLPADTPSRYLAKVLLTVDASAAAVERFTATFERAMFSPYEIGRSDQQDAVDALAAVRDELHLLARADRVEEHR